MYYNSRPTEGKKAPKVFVQSKDWKLYSSGELYNYANDLYEKKAFKKGQETELASTMRHKLQEVLDQYPLEGEMIYKLPQGFEKTAKVKKKKKAKE